MILTIVWGVFLRASGSGDGCGTHWPLCGDVLLPKLGQTPHKTWVEWLHRFMSEGLGLLVLGQLIWAFRAFPERECAKKMPWLPSLLLWPKRLSGAASARKAALALSRSLGEHPVRLGAVATTFFVLSEAWLGRQLVVYKYVAYSDAPQRVYWMAAHLCNTFCLVAALALTAWWASGQRRVVLKNQGPLLALVLVSLLATLGLSITGSISALGDMLYPVSSHLEAMRQASLPTANALMKARPTHPYTAVVVAMLLCLTAGLLAHLRPSEQTRRFSYAVWFLLSAQMVLGLANIWLLAPIWMQVVHLFAADLLWVCVVLMSAAALAQGVPQVEMQHVPQAVIGGERATIKDYVALTKPRVISLLLFTTLAAMFIAAKGWPGASFGQGLWLLFATGTGLYAAAGASNAINMVCERDLDVRMERTASRPTVTERIHPRAALWFAFALEVGSFGLLWRSSNLLAATMALAGLVVYVIVYTLLLKRRSWSNIVIGGAAGAFPPLVGYAAAAGELTPLAWMLFALIFVWTPVHFWALAILIKDDYAKAGVPMLPVVRGNRHTVEQIAFYAVITVAVSFAPLFFGMGAGVCYGLVALVLNLVLARGCWRLLKEIDRPQASSLFHYSMIYLALLFLALAVDVSGRWMESFAFCVLMTGFFLWKFPVQRVAFLGWLGSLVSKPTPSV